VVKFSCKGAGRKGVVRVSDKEIAKEILVSLINKYGLPGKLDDSAQKAAEMLETIYNVVSKLK
jgi:hypothetical protein